MKLFTTFLALATVAMSFAGGQDCCAKQGAMAKATKPAQACPAEAKTAKAGKADECCQAKTAKAIKQSECTDCKAGAKTAKAIKQSECTDCKAGAKTAKAGKGDCKDCAVAQTKAAHSAKICKACDAKLTKAFAGHDCKNCKGGAMCADCKKMAMNMMCKDCNAKVAKAMKGAACADCDKMAKGGAKMAGDACCNTPGSPAKFKVFAGGKYHFFGCADAAETARVQLMEKYLDVSEIQKVSGNVKIG